jgi:hypothetical protein
MKTPTLLASLLVAAAASAAAQQPQGDLRWQAWLGCWTAVNGTAPNPTGKAPVVCVIPSGGGVDVATVIDTQIVARDHIEVLAERHPVTRAGCTGWETSSWSRGNDRVYRQSEYTCPGDVKRSTSELIAMTPSWEWLDVQGLAANGGTGVRVLRYRTAAVPAVPEIALSLQSRTADVSLSRGAAAARPAVSDVIEASRSVDPAVVEAWVAEEGEGFPLNGKELLALANSGVSGRVVDVMVAISYPKVFAVARPSSQGEFSPVDASRRAPPVDTSYAYSQPYYGSGYYPPYGWDYYSPYSWSPYGYYSPYGYSPYGYGPYGYGGYGGYYGGGTIVIVPGGGSGGNPAAPHGKVVNGRGYTRNRGGSGAQPQASTSHNPAPSSAGASGAQPSSSSGSSGGSSSGSSQAGQKAHPRP